MTSGGGPVIARRTLWVVASLVAVLAFGAYRRWRAGDAFYIPGVGAFYRFPCSSYSNAIVGQSPAQPSRVRRTGPPSWTPAADFGARLV
jgi:hypothetical protein